jgi:ADP-ribose pyrophosphatase
MPFGPEPPQLLKQRFFYKGRKFSFEANRFRLPNKAEGEWECVRHPGGALAVPITPEGKFVLVRQYRFTTRGRLLEFPAGTIEVGEDPLATIEREIQEEIGYRAQRWQKLGEFFVAPGYSDEIIYAFLAQELEHLENPPPPDVDEDLTTVVMTTDEVEQAIYSGELIDAKSICAFFMSRPFLHG